MAEWFKAADCKSTEISHRRFKSCFLYQMPVLVGKVTTSKSEIYFQNYVTKHPHSQKMSVGKHQIFQLFFFPKKRLERKITFICRFYFSFSKYDADWKRACFGSRKTCVQITLFRIFFYICNSELKNYYFTVFILKRVAEFQLNNSIKFIV